MIQLEPYVEAMIEFYAHDLKAEAEATDQFRTLDETFGSNDAFKRARPVLRKYRPTLAALTTESTQRQAIACLHAMKGEPGLETRAVLRQFAVASFAGKWSDEQKRRFERIAAALIDGYDYFFSFTGRSLAQGAILRVNREYMEFIVQVLSDDAIRKANKSEDNLLASALDVLLKERLFKGFFYPDRKGDSAQVRAKLQDAVDRAICLVQLLDNVMFVSSQNADENWSYWEFKRALEAQLRMLFVFPYEKRDELLGQADRLEALDDWYQQVLGADLRVLPVAPIDDRRNIARINEEIAKLSAQMRSERNTAIESIPVQ